MEKIGHFLDLGVGMLLPMFIGGIILGVLLALPTYPLAYHVVLRLRAARERRRSHRQARVEARRQDATPPENGEEGIEPVSGDGAEEEGNGKTG